MRRDDRTRYQRTTTTLVYESISQTTLPTMVSFWTGNLGILSEQCHCVGMPSYVSFNCFRATKQLLWNMSSRECRTSGKTCFSLTTDQYFSVRMNSLLRLNPAQDKQIYFITMKFTLVHLCPAVSVETWSDQFNISTPVVSISTSWDPSILLLMHADLVSRVTFNYFSGRTILGTLQLNSPSFEHRVAVLVYI